MAVAISWVAAIAETDFATAPTVLTDPNVVSGTEVAETVALSAEFTGGTDPTMSIEVYYWDALAEAFFFSGDTFNIDPDNGNLAIMNPNGLTLGFKATVTGSPTSPTLNVGTR